MWVLGYEPWRSVLCSMTELWKDVWEHACVHVCTHWRCLCMCTCADLWLSTQGCASDTPTLPDLSSESMCSAREVNELLIPGVHVRTHLDLRQTGRLAGEGVGERTARWLRLPLLLSPRLLGSRAVVLGGTWPMWHQTQKRKPSQGLVLSSLGPRSWGSCTNWLVQNSVG